MKGEGDFRPFGCPVERRRATQGLLPFNGTNQGSPDVHVDNVNNSFGKGWLEALKNVGANREANVCIDGLVCDPTSARVITIGTIFTYRCTEIETVNFVALYEWLHIRTANITIDDNVVTMVGHLVL